MYKIMIVDDEVNVLHALKRMLSKAGDWEIVTCANPHDALDIAHDSHFHLFLSDYRMPGMNGVDFLIHTRRLHPNSMRLILSGATDFEGLVSAINEAEIYRFIAKPTQAVELIATIKQALQFFEIAQENQLLADQVRRQQKELERREYALKKLAKEHPLIAQVNWGEDGEIMINKGDV